MATELGSEYSGSVTFNAAAGLAAELGATHHAWSIAELVSGYLKLANELTPEDPLNWQRDDLAQEIKLQALSDPLGKKVAVIDMMDYGMMKGDAVLDKALKLME